MHLSKLNSIFVGFFLVAGLTGCLNLNNEESMDEDSIATAVGGLAFSNVNGANGLSNSLSASGAPSLTEQSTGIPSDQDNAPLAKLGADKVVTIDSSTMNSEGTITLTVTDEAGGVLSSFIMVIKCEANAQLCAEAPVNVVSLETREENTALNIINTMSITDLDNDGIVNGEPQYSRTARVHFTHQAPFLGSIYLEETTLDVNSGEDGDFGDENGDPAEVTASQDNQILALSWTKKRNGDVINSATYTDADNDGIIANPSSSTPSLVHLEMFETGNIFKPFVESSTLNMTLEVTPGIEDGRIVAISGTENMKNGRVNNITVENADGSNVIVPNADVNIILATEFPVTEDSLVKSELRMLINVGAGLEDSTDNLLKEIHAFHEARLGPVAVATFDFVANPPVPHGQDPQGGAVEMSVEFRNGDSYSVSGEFSPDGLHLTITGPQGNSITGEWDSEGNLLSSQSNS